MVHAVFDPLSPLPQCPQLIIYYPGSHWSQTLRYFLGIQRLIISIGLVTQAYFYQTRGIETLTLAMSSSHQENAGHTTGYEAQRLQTNELEIGITEAVQKHASRHVVCRTLVYEKRLCLPIGLDSSAANFATKARLRACQTSLAQGDAGWSDGSLLLRLSRYRLSSRILPEWYGAAIQLSPPNWVRYVPSFTLFLVVLSVVERNSKAAKYLNNLGCYVHIHPGFQPLKKHVSS